MGQFKSIVTETQETERLSEERAAEFKETLEKAAAKAKRSKKRTIAASLNFQKARILSAAMTLEPLCGAAQKSNLRYIVRKCLDALQDKATAEGIKGNYTRFLPEEKTQHFKKMKREQARRDAELSKLRETSEPKEADKKQADLF